MKRKSIAKWIFTTVMTAAMLAGCGTAKETGTQSGEPVFAIWDNNLMDYIDEHDMIWKFQELYPDATFW